MHEISDIEKFYCKDRRLFNMSGIFFTKISKCGLLRTWLKMQLDNKYKRLMFVWTNW